MIQTPTRNFAPIQQLSPDHTLNKPMLLDKVGWGPAFPCSWYCIIMGTNKRTMHGLLPKPAEKKCTMLTMKAPFPQPTPTVHRS
jgi:hypothetical protein